MTPDEQTKINQPEAIVVQEDATTVVTASVAGTAKEKRKPRILVKKRGGMFDVPEIAAVSVAGFLLLMVLMAYLFWLRPAETQLRQRQQTRNALDAEYLRLKTTFGENQTTESKVNDIVGSLERFEANYLSPPSQGNASLFARLNEIIRGNNLRNVAGPDYAPLETVALEKYDPTKIAETKNQNLYPGTAVTVTVEGGYANLRRFISELENSSQFIVLRAIEIEASTSNSGGSDAQSAADVNTVRNAPQTSGIPPQISGLPPTGGARPQMTQPRAPQTTQQPATVQPQQSAPRVARGSTVSMRVDLVSYFRRTGDAPQTRAAQNQ